MRISNSIKIYVERYFYHILFLITILSFIIRFKNTAYASMWSDELWSMLSVHPDNSMYDNLNLQRRDQPPLYFIILKMWVILFGYNDFSARILSVILGSISVFVIGYINRNVFNKQIALLSAFITAFSYTHIYYSLEARFYSLLFLLVTISFYTYLHIQKNRGSLYYNLVHGIICAAMILTHYFAFFVVIAYCLSDLKYFIENKFDQNKFKNIVIGYLICTIITGIWLYWSYRSMKTVNGYWLKEINLIQYFLFSFSYSDIVLAVILITAFLGFIYRYKLQNKFTLVLVLQCILVMLIPLLLSYLFFPILVIRYSYAMTPALYTLLAIGIYSSLVKLGRYRYLGLVVIIAFLTYDSINYSYLDRKALYKEPWRQMAEWIKKQPGYPGLPVYTTGIWVNGRFTIDYYLPECKVKNLLWDSSGISKLGTFYLVETNGHDRIPIQMKKSIEANYDKREINFGFPENGKGGLITEYRFKK